MFENKFWSLPRFCIGSSEGKQESGNEQDHVNADPLNKNLEEDLQTSIQCLEINKQY